MVWLCGLAPAPPHRVGWGGPTIPLDRPAFPPILLEIRSLRPLGSLQSGDFHFDIFHSIVWFFRFPHLLPVLAFLCLLCALRVSALSSLFSSTSLTCLRRRPKIRARMEFLSPGRPRWARRAPFRPNRMRRNNGHFFPRRSHYRGRRGRAPRRDCCRGGEAPPPCRGGPLGLP